MSFMCLKNSIRPLIIRKKLFVKLNATSMDSIIEQIAKIIAHECVDPMYNLPYSTRYISFIVKPCIFATFNTEY